VGRGTAGPGTFHVRTGAIWRSAESTNKRVGRQRTEAREGKAATKPRGQIYFSAECRIEKADS
jgi:hypothetical protein